MIAALMSYLVVGQSSEDRFWDYIVANRPSYFKLESGAREASLKIAHQLCDEIPDAAGRRKALRNSREPFEPLPDPGPDAPIGQEIAQGIVEGISGFAHDLGFFVTATFTYICPP